MHVQSQYILIDCNIAVHATQVVFIEISIKKGCQILRADSSYPQCLHLDLRSKK